MIVVNPPRYEVRRLPPQVTGRDREYGAFDTFAQQFIIEIKTPRQGDIAAAVRQANYTYERSVR